MILVENKKARFDYEITESLVAGMALEGWEVKSLRAKHGNMTSSWIKLKSNGAEIQNLKISPWPHSFVSQETDRPKKLLLRKKEVGKWMQKIKEKGLTIIPLKIFTDKKFIKCEIGLGKGRKKYEKKQVMKERTQKKDAREALKKFNAHYNTK